MTDEQEKITKNAIAKWLDTNKEKLAQKGQIPGVSLPQLNIQMPEAPASYPEYDIIVIHDHTHEFLNQVHVDTDSSTITIYLAEGVEYKDYDKSRVAQYVAQGINILNVRGTVATAIRLGDAITCYWFTADKGVARDYPIEVSEKYEFDRPAMFG